MRNYLYISDAKVDMLLPQITGVEKKKVAAEFGFNLEVLSGSIKTERESLLNRVHRLAAVESAIRKKYEIGSIGRLRDWVEGTVDMVPARFGKHPELCFHFVDQTFHFFALGGSSHHVVGDIRAASATAGLSHTDRLLATLETAVYGQPGWYQKRGKALAQSLHKGITPFAGVLPWTRLLEELSRQFEHAPRQRVSFLARKLVSETWVPDGKRYTLATPLYIALADG
jgi:hypothetical protein